MPIGSGQSLRCQFVNFLIITIKCTARPVWRSEQTENSYDHPHTTRHSRESGNPGAEIGAHALDPRVRGGDDKWLVILNKFSVRYLRAINVYQ
jgi:hypothetical protein